MSIANNIAFEEECKRREGEEISFDGQNCDDCTGWTPPDHRCSCGNRRVSWVEDYGHSFKEPDIYGEAY